MYSAIKYQGKPLYKIAREGKIIPRKKRLITIFKINLLTYDDGAFTIDVLCSKGTYIIPIPNPQSPIPNPQSPYNII